VTCTVVRQLQRDSSSLVSLQPYLSDDLARRLGSFGSVTAMDGLGKLDALGQPRNFAHVTLETTKTQLSKCTLPLPALPFF